MFGGISDALAQRVLSLLERITCGLSDLGTQGAAVEVGTTGTARALAYQYGVPPEAGQAAALAPRSMLAGPLELDTQVTQRTTFDVLEATGRFAFTGFIANVGDDVYRAAWQHADGSVGNFFRMPPGSTRILPAILRGVVVEPVDGNPAEFQGSFS